MLSQIPLRSLSTCFTALLWTNIGIQILFFIFLEKQYSICSLVQILLLPVLQAGMVLWISTCLHPSELHSNHSGEGGPPLRWRAASLAAEETEAVDTFSLLCRFVQIFSRIKHYSARTPQPLLWDVVVFVSDAAFAVLVTWVAIEACPQDSVSSFPIKHFNQFGCLFGSYLLSPGLMEKSL